MKKPAAASPIAAFSSFPDEAFPDEAFTAKAFTLSTPNSWAISVLWALNAALGHALFSLCSNISACQSTRQLSW